MDQNSENYQNESEVFLEDDSEEIESVAKKKNLSTLVIIEIILFLIVIILAITFFSSRGSFNFLRTSTKVDTSEQGKEQLNKDDLVVSDDKNNNLEAVSPGDDVTSPSPGETTVVESLRLTLPVPDQSPVSLESDIPQGAIKIEGLEEGFSPSEFKVAKGEMITLALVSRVDSPYILTFYHESMPAISIGLGPQETRWISFKAPEVKGEYEFRNDIFGKSTQRGKMIVE